MTADSSDPGGTRHRERIVTARLLLDPLTLPVARAIVAGRSHLPAAPGWPHQDTVDGLIAFVNAASTDADGGWLIMLRAGGEVIGEAGWKGRPGPDGTVEIGYGLAAPSRGQGYGQEAVAALVEWMLARPDCRRVVAEVLADNIASRRLLERIGFAVERVEPPHVWYQREAG